MTPLRMEQFKSCDFTQMIGYSHIPCHMTLCSQNNTVWMMDRFYFRNNHWLIVVWYSDYHICTTKCFAFQYKDHVSFHFHLFCISFSSPEVMVLFSLTWDLNCFIYKLFLQYIKICCLWLVYSTMTRLWFYPIRVCQTCLIFWADFRICCFHLSHII